MKQTLQSWCQMNEEVREAQQRTWNQIIIYANQEEGKNSYSKDTDEKNWLDTGKRA